MANDRLRLLVERIEGFEAEQRAIGEDKRDTYAEAKAVGYDPKIIREIVRLRRMAPDVRAERDAVLDTYRQELGIG